MSYTTDKREKQVVLKITYTGRRPGFWTRHRLKTWGYARYRLSGRRFFWKKQMIFDKRVVRREAQYCQKKGLKFSCTDLKYTRSTGYRRAFFDKNGGILGRGNHYFCAYCGKIKPAGKITVDHLIPVYGASTRKKYRFFLRLLGTDNVNDIRNLAPACEKCNQKKGSRGGFWIFRGMAGRHNVFWYAFYLVLTALILLFFLNRRELLLFSNRLWAYVWPALQEIKAALTPLISDLENLR